MTERFELIEEVGRGAMGVVWKARDNERGKIVAVKTLRDLHLDDPEYVNRFAREVDLARSVKSPHVVRVRGYGVRQGVPFVVLEFVTGQSLRARVAERGPFPPSGARDLLAQIAEALAAVHAVGIVHRDVKASNVLLTEDGVAKLTDFGIARGRDARRATHKGSLLGTPAYMAPEGPVDARSDLYSLGVVYYEILTGVLPFASSSYQEVIRAHVETMPDLTRVPASERGLTGWLMSKDPSGRPQSAEALLASLRSGGAGTARRPSSDRSAEGQSPAPKHDVSATKTGGGTWTRSPSSTPTAPPASPARPAYPDQPAAAPAPAPAPYQAPPLMPAWRPYDTTRGPAQSPGARARDRQAVIVALVVGLVSVLAVGAVVMMALVSSRSSSASGSQSGQGAAGGVLALFAVAVLAVGAIAVAAVMALSRSRQSAARRGPGSGRRLPPNSPPPGGPPLG
jgi:serine/threonine protein kinase